MSQTRHKARRLATQALYTWQVAGQDLADIEAQYCTDLDMSKIDSEYFHELLHKVPARIEELDEHIAPLLDRGMEEVDGVERAILRLGCYELAYRLDVPYRVVINESVKLAKTFGADQSHKYINGILDGIAKKLRAAEMNARPNPAAKGTTKAASKVATKISTKAAPKISTKAPTKTSTKAPTKAAAKAVTKKASTPAPTPASKYKPR
jgi:N utilization substance protein B